MQRNVSHSDNASWPGWQEAGFKTLKRKISRELSFSQPQAFPGALAILIPDLVRIGRIPLPTELLFFDLETTGLSGGAGTIAFLAAFGRFALETKKNANAQIEITQYLLLDYPGEADFIEMLLEEFTSAEGGAPPSRPPLVTYNGKCFDSQILKNRCLMNGVAPPLFFHVDLLHPARRLWKRMLPDCCQTTVEVSVLGLDRSGDLSGALAPDIWFSFLRSGETNELLSICDHNVRDILGLSSLILSLGEIAAEPVKSRSKFRFDGEALAHYWRKALKKGALLFGEDESYTFTTSSPGPHQLPGRPCCPFPSRNVQE